MVILIVRYFRRRYRNRGLEIFGFEEINDLWILFNSNKKKERYEKY